MNWRVCNFFGHSFQTWTFPKWPPGEQQLWRTEMWELFQIFSFSENYILSDLVEFPVAVPMWWTDSLGHQICDQKFPQHNFPIRLSSTEKFRKVTLRVLWLLLSFPENCRAFTGPLRRIPSHGWVSYLLLISISIVKYIWPTCWLSFPFSFLILQDNLFLPINYFHWDKTYEYWRHVRNTKQNFLRFCDSHSWGVAKLLIYIIIITLKILFSFLKNIYSCILQCSSVLSTTVKHHYSGLGI